MAIKPLRYLCAGSGTPAKTQVALSGTFVVSQAWSVRF